MHNLRNHEEEVVRKKEAGAEMFSGDHKTGQEILERGGLGGGGPLLSSYRAAEAWKSNSAKRTNWWRIFQNISEHFSETDTNPERCIASFFSSC